ncbi:hypothetical protein BDV19DRAFT_381429 [Aspergillus venezuelensis]
MGLSETSYTTEHTRDPQAITKIKRRGFDWDGSCVLGLGSITLALVGLALLVTFLVKINNTPYANWQYTMAPNTVVSITVTISKSALLVSVSSCLAPLYHKRSLDQASRGPWGSLEVLLRGIFGSKTGILTYFGASLTILALAADPVAQQILTFPSRTVSARNATAFTHTSQKLAASEGLNETDVHLELPSPLLSAVLSGLVQTNTPLEPQCNSGSCEFADYKSPSNFEFIFQVQYFEYEYSDWENPDPHELDFIQRRSPILDIQAPIVSFIEVDYTDPVYYTISNVTAPPTKPRATECAVYFCERQYAASSYLPGNRDSSSGQVIKTQKLIAQDVKEENPTILDMEDMTFNSFEPLMMSLFNSMAVNKFNISIPDNLKLAAFLRGEDNSESLDSMTTSVTDALRLNKYEEGYIHVRWPWIFLPAVVTVGSALLLLGTAIASKRKKAVLWKCTVLPLLSSRLDTTPENEIVSVRIVDEMTAMSKKMHAVVVQDEGPLIFKEK